MRALNCVRENKSVIILHTCWPKCLWSLSWVCGSRGTSGWRDWRGRCRDSCTLSKSGGGTLSLSCNSRDVIPESDSKLMLSPADCGFAVYHSHEINRVKFRSWASLLFFSERKTTPTTAGWARGQSNLLKWFYSWPITGGYCQILQDQYINK